MKECLQRPEKSPSSRFVSEIDARSAVGLEGITDVLSFAGFA